MTMTTRHKIKAVQRKLHLVADGIAGKLTWSAIYDDVVGVSKSAVETPQASIIPNDTQEDIERVYGDAGDESNLVRFTFPYAMKLYGETPIKTHRCHKLVKDDLEAIFQDIYDTFGMDYIKKHHLDHYDGCFNYRKARGGSSTSRHSWGIAIDIAADLNGNRTRKPKADMPWEVIEIFERYGWKSGGRAWGRDFMHFARTNM
jgi:hypothetical protein